jgi:hypothetical protein
MQTITVMLDTVKKTRGKHEWRPVNRATCEYNGATYTHTGDGSNIKIVLQEIADAGCAMDTMVHVMRGEGVVFMPATLNSWVGKRNNQPEWLKRSKTAT